MEVKKGQRWSKNGKVYVVKDTSDGGNFTYIITLKEGEADVKDNRRMFGISVFLELFKFIKEVKDG